MRISNVQGKIGLAVAGFTAVLGISALASFSQPSVSSAATACDTVNIVYCGLTGSTDAGYVSSFKSDYTADTSNGHSDLKQVYNWAGASDSIVSGMNTSNTKLGTMYKNGQVVVDGKTVATDAWVTARFTEGTGYVKVEGDVYARKTTTSLAEATAPVIVYFNSNNQAVFAVMTGCGNAIKMTPVPPAPTPTPAPATLVCDDLTFVKNSTDTYTFTTKHTASTAMDVTTLTTFGDSTKASTTTGIVSHTYAKPGTYTIQSTVSATYNGKALSNTNKNCVATITIPAPTPTPTPKPTPKPTPSPVVTPKPTPTPVVTPKPTPSPTPTPVVTPTPTPVIGTLSCVSLGLNEVSTGTNGAMNYTLTATAEASNATITNYVFNYGDNSATDTVTTSDTSATSDVHSYAPGTYNTITVTVYGTANGKTVSATSTACGTTLTVPAPTCTAPNSTTTYPAGSAECTPTTPTTPTPTALVNTGPGSMIGTFAASSVIGSLGFRFLQKRRGTSQI
jgi:hypothetical protein